jgi:hypothetical protein
MDDVDRVPIDVEDLDSLNLRTLHLLTTTDYETIQFLQGLKLLRTEPSDPCPKNCNKWYLAYSQSKGPGGMFLKYVLIK